MKLNSLRVLKLTESVRTGAEPRVTVPKGTRVVVVNTKDNVITVRVHASAGALAKTRLVVTEKQVEQTFRGRPKKATV
jgi:hypothetical protein